MRDIAAYTARAACLSPVVEEPGLMDGTRMRSGDVMLPGFQQGRDTLIDVTVDPLQQGRVVEASHTPGAAMREVKASKRGAYRRRREEEGGARLQAGGVQDARRPLGRGGSDPPQEDNIDPCEESGEGRGADHEVPGPPGVPRHPANQCSLELLWVTYYVDGNSINR